MNRPFKTTELLAIGLCVGTLIALAFLSVRTARASLRDAVRLSDVRDIQLGLELYFNDASAYPSSPESIPLGAVSTSCLSRSGFRANCTSSQEAVYTQIVRQTPTQGLKKKVSCGNVKNAYCYKASEDMYGIEFELERKNTIMGLDKGINCAMPGGMKQGACQSL